MADGKIKIEGVEYNYAEYLQKVMEYVQMKGFNKEAFQHISALFWDLDRRVQALERAPAPAKAAPAPIVSIDAPEMDIPSISDIKAPAKKAK